MIPFRSRTLHIAWCSNRYMFTIERLPSQHCISVEDFFFHLGFRLRKMTLVSYHGARTFSISQRTDSERHLRWLRWPMRNYYQRHLSLSKIEIYSGGRSFRVSRNRRRKNKKKTKNPMLCRRTSQTRALAWTRRKHENVHSKMVTHFHSIPFNWIIIIIMFRAPKTNYINTALRPRYRPLCPYRMAYQLHVIFGLVSSMTNLFRLPQFTFRYNFIRKIRALSFRPPPPPLTRHSDARKQTHDTQTD